ncbi:NAD-dependent protein deacetylase hst2-1 [Tolypocladium ophioglossoides CBS 100239]|uniref:NAD-dependent protein deacetylase hst2-1 n=1 Tax=Tolypocladium ophioglossoides (strain CBS 100239) TaxID=1163406 RepID=A0A0L0N0W5_TOLOC|nr:NAD-dependent protein deacetylase hst2-1 [Tolypocladium ophioglossoides CBS 100239]
MVGCHLAAAADLSISRNDVSHRLLHRRHTPPINTSPPTSGTGATLVSVQRRLHDPLVATIGRHRRSRNKPKARIPRYLRCIMGQDVSTLVDDSVPPRSLSARTLSAVAEYINGGDKKRIVVLAGAGISTAAGIPDFRSPKTGLYNNLARLNLPYAEAVFDIDFFRKHPEPFYVLAQELYPGKFHPTVSHVFIALLAQKGLLQMLFTQNIDCLERRAGVPAHKIVEAHGSFATQRCIECKTEFPDDKMMEHVSSGKVPQCMDARCGGTVKPDIVFFGEPLPEEFIKNSIHTSMADLMLIIGTSLSVYPFAALPELPRDDMPRVLFNMEKVGKLGSRTDDVIQLGAVDDSIRKLADELGWRDELERMWRDVVGDEEAERQLRSQKKHEEEIEDEVQKLTEGIEAALNFDDAENSEEAPKSQEESTTCQTKEDDDKKSVAPLGEQSETTETTKRDDNAGATEPAKLSGKREESAEDQLTSTEPDEEALGTPGTVEDKSQDRGQDKGESQEKPLL